MPGGNPVNRNDPTGLCTVDGVDYPDDSPQCDPSGVTVTADSLMDLPPILDFGPEPPTLLNYYNVPTTQSLLAASELWLPKKINNGTTAQSNAVSEGYDDALSRLMNNPLCNSYLDGAADGAPDSNIGLAESVLENTTYTLEPFGNNASGTLNTSTAAQVVTNSLVFINTNPGSVFFNQTGFVMPGNLTGADADALFLLHELAHQTGVFGDDTGNQTLENQENQNIFTHCFK